MVAPPRRLRRVLVVDDDRSVGVATRALLHSTGDYQVEVFTEARAALARLQEARFDVVISDVNMPALTGAELHQRLEALDPGAARRFIFIYGDPSEGEPIIRRTGTFGLAKPFCADALLAVVEAAAQRVV